MREFDGGKWSNDQSDFLFLEMVRARFTVYLDGQGERMKIDDSTSRSGTTRSTATQPMRLILVDRGRDFCEALRLQFRGHPEVEVACGRFEDLPVFDCVITAGNSFGLMDAGMDLAVVRYFGT